MNIAYNTIRIQISGYLALVGWRCVPFSELPSFGRFWVSSQRDCEALPTVVVCSLSILRSPLDRQKIGVAPPHPVKGSRNSTRSNKGQQCNAILDGSRGLKSRSLTLQSSQVLGSTVFQSVLTSVTTRIGGSNNVSTLSIICWRMT